MKFWKFLNIAATETAPESVELRIDGDIVSDDDAWFYEVMGIPAVSPNAFRAELAAHRGKPISVWINSFGGDVYAATGIYNALKEHDAKVVVKIDAVAMSAASVIAMAGAEVMMAPGAIMMIHNPLTFAQGDMHDLRHVADVLDTVKEAIINAYQLKTGKSRKKIAEMMDNETYMSARSAIKDGFADGMLYAEATDPITDLAQSWNYSRLAIQNCSRAATARLVELGGGETTENAALKAMLELEAEI